MRRVPPDRAARRSGRAARAEPHRAAVARAAVSRLRGAPSMSLTMGSMSMEHVTMALIMARTASRGVDPSRVKRALAMLVTDISGLRRSCMTVRMSRDLACMAAACVRPSSAFSASIWAMAALRR